MNKFLIACLISSTSFSASADFLFGGDIEVNAWQQSQSHNNVLLNEDDEEIAYTFEASFEHFLPLIPNPKVSQSNVDADTFKYTKRDFTLYYEFLDNDILTLDLGIGVTKLFEGSTFRNGSWKSNNGIVPHVYGLVEIGIPFTPLFVYAKGTAFTYETNDMLDASAGIKYSIPLTVINLEFQAGYRLQRFNLTSEEILTIELQTIDLDSETDGFFAGVNIDF